MRLISLFTGMRWLISTCFFNWHCYGQTRGHGLKLFTPYARLDTRKHSFSVRVVKHWNRLSEDAVNAASINIFKGHVDDYIKKGAYTRQ